MSTSDMWDEQMIKILDYFAANYPNEYHAGDTISEMVINTIEALERRLKTPYHSTSNSTPAMFSDYQGGKNV